jgi:hypothetical protein
VFINQLKGLPLLKTRIKLADIIPKLLKDNTARKRITAQESILALEKSILKTKTAKNRYINKLKLAVKKFHNTIPDKRVINLVGVRIKDSRVPWSCSVLKREENEPSPTPI